MREEFKMKFSEINPFVRNIELIEEAISYSDKFYYDCRMLFVCEGSATLECDNDIQKMKKGSVAIIRCGKIHSLCVEPSSCIMDVHFDYTSRFATANSYPLSINDAASFSHKKLLSLVTFEDAPWMNGNIFLDDMNILEHDFFKAFAESNKMDTMFDTVLSNIVSNILICILRRSDVSLLEARINSADEMAYKITDYINRNYTLPINSKSISKVFPYNPDYLNRIVKKYTGYSICRYVIMCRLSRAMFLLESDMTISEISKNVGFNELSHFSRCFKKYIGMSPLSYKDGYKKNDRS